MKDLRPTSVERFVTQLRAKGLSDSTVRQVYTVARAIGDDAVRDGRMARNPFATVRRPRLTQAEASFLEPDEISRLLKAAEDSRYRPLFEFLVHTGLRRGEALALTWNDIDLEHRLVRVRGTLARINGQLMILEPKSAKSRRTIPLSDPAADVLRHVRERTASERLRAAQLWVDSGHVFATDIGEPSDPRNALRALSVAARRAGLVGVGLHTLRHSAASVMLSQRVLLNVVSQILGHSGISITADVYGHIAPDVSRSAVDILGAALTPLPLTSTPLPPTSPRGRSADDKDAHKDAARST
jgi:integrase